VNVLDLFSGIGGFSLGLERAGMRTVAFCEIDPCCRAVLKKHWPDVPRYEDVRTLTKQRLDADGISVDLIAGGFPCQDISVAGAGAGINGERSGLWSEYARIIGEVRPRYVIVENVAALLGRGLDRVLGDLAALRFDAEWHCIPASAIGAPHRRDRVWIIAHPTKLFICGGRSERKPRQAQVPRSRDGCCASHAADSWGERIQRLITQTLCGEHAFSWCEDIGGIEELRGRSDLPEPLVCRNNDGLPERLHALGNAVVPQIPEIIGKAIMQAEGLA